VIMRVVLVLVLVLVLVVMIVTRMLARVTTMVIMTLTLMMPAVPPPPQASLLLRAGAAWKLEDEEGLTPLDVTHHVHNDIVTLLNVTRNTQIITRKSSRNMHIGPLATAPMSSGSCITSHCAHQTPRPAVYDPCSVT
jgi:hypothetical protein